MNLTLFKSIFFSLVMSTTTVLAQGSIQIDKEMQQAIEKIAENSVPGISVAIVKGNNIIWSGAAGYSNIEENRIISQSHLFGIGDITNQYVGAVIIQLAEEGIVDLNATPQDILGDVVSNIENADTANLYQLLNHTSGIYSWSDDADWARRGRGVQMNPKYLWRRDEPLKYTTRNLHSATNPPGEVYAFSKTNYTILGLIIEKLTGGQLEVEIRNRIFTPLNLRNTYYDSYEVVPNGSLVGNYHLATDLFISKVGINAKFAFGADQLINTSGASLSVEGLAGGIVTSARELALFAASLWNGKILTPENFKYIKPESINGHSGIHSEILGFTADIRQIEANDLIIVSMVNLGVVNTGNSERKTFLDNYLDKILIPIAKKYAQVK